MSHESYYFAYGSNMNPGRVAERGLLTTSVVAARLPDFRLAFNKRSRRNPAWACANIQYAPGEVVEGVLYQLAGVEEIHKMDPYEGTPRFYSRDHFHVITEAGPIVAWTYVANPAVIADDILPLRWYLGQLLEGAEFLSPEYIDVIRNTPCLDIEDAAWG